MSARSGIRSDASFQTRNEHRVEQLRVPPQSIEAEQAVLGGLMLAPERVTTASPTSWSRTTSTAATTS